MIAPRHAPSDESATNKKEYEINRDNDWSTCSRHKKKKPENKYSSNEVDNHRNKHEELESDLEDYEENENKDGEGTFFHLRKTQEQLEECAVEIDKKKRENKKHMKEKEEEEKLLIDEHLCINAC